MNNPQAAANTSLAPTREHNITIAALDIVFDDLQACSKPSVTSARSKDRANPSSSQPCTRMMPRSTATVELIIEQAAYMTNELLPIVAVASET